MIDIKEDIQQQVRPEDLALVINAARDLMRLEMEIADLELQVKVKTEKYRLMATETVPELMKSVGQTELPLANGYKLKVESVVRASIPAESTIERANEEERPLLEARRAEAFVWLRANKAGSLIKDEVRISLGKGQSSFVKKLLAVIRKTAKSAKADIFTEQKETVHPSTLSKYIREKLEAGAEVPLETFSVFQGHEAQVIPPKGVKR